VTPDTMFDSHAVTDAHMQDVADRSPDTPVGLFEPPRGFVLTAISRHKWLVLAVAAIFTVIGLATGVKRKPTYTATTTLQVGTVNLNSPGFDGFVQGATQLATVFSRAIFASSVLSELHSKLGLSSNEVSQRVSAEPIPLSPSFDIVATGSNTKGAIDLANTTSKAVIAYEQKAASATSPQAAGLLKEYGSASEAVQRAHALVEFYAAEEARDHANAAKSGSTPSAMPLKALVKARAAEADAKTRAEAIGASYRSVTTTAAGASPASGLVSMVAEASTTTNNHKSKIELYGLIGLFGGIILGCVAAVVRERRVRKRMIAGEMDAGIHESAPA
jgi:capsular polysaccharide biosynthesis protein